MNYRLDFTKRFSIVVEADNEDEAIENAMHELKRPNSIDIEEEDLVNIEELK